MTTAQPDKTGLHILLKLAALVVILAGIHAAADIIVQLLLALFFAIVLNPLVAWFIRRGVRRPVAITLVVVVMLFVLTALIGVLASSITEFMAMLPKYNKELTRKVLHLQEMVPFLNLHMSPERMLQRMDSDKIMTFTTTLMTSLSGAMASVVLLVMTVVFMLFEVRHVPYKLRFSLNNPQIHIAGAASGAQGRISLSGTENVAQLMDRCHHLAGSGADGDSVCSDVGRAGLPAKLRAQHWLGHFRRPAHDPGAAVQRHLRMRTGWCAIPGGAYGYWQYPRTPHDGASAGIIDAYRLPLFAGMGMAARPGRHAALRAANQRV